MWTDNYIKLQCSLPISRLYLELQTLSRTRCFYLYFCSIRVNSNFVWSITTMFIIFKFFISFYLNKWTTYLKLIGINHPLNASILRQRSKALPGIGAGVVREFIVAKTITLSGPVACLSLCLLLSCYCLKAVLLILYSIVSNNCLKTTLLLYLFK